MKKRTLYLLSLISALLLAFAWPFTGSITAFIFIAFIPLLYVEQNFFLNPLQHKTLHLFGCSFLTFFIWNLLTTWWVYNASAGGAAMAIISNSMLMAMVFQLYHITRKRLKGRYSAFILVSYWLSFELLHFNWDLAYPWLTLGNVFAGTTQWIQWYEYTGVFGGSLWILTVNLLLFKLFISSYTGSRFRWRMFLISLLILLPIVVSYFVYVASWTISKSRNVSVVIVQPNIDPYNEKFSGTYKEQLDKMLALAETKLDAYTQYLVFPETALTESIWENNMEQTYSINALRLFMTKYPRLKIVIGASTAYQVQQGEAISATAKKFKDADIYYEDYNTALQLDSTGIIQKYHKSKLVPGVEKMPFPYLLKPLENLAIDMGGTSGSLTGQKERTVFVSDDESLKVAPVICYESVFGEYLGGYIKNGANIIFIITNDGWWGDTPGYKQHLVYGTLRAIETRRCIARSANTGISCFIDELGRITQPTSWWQPAVIKGSLLPNNEFTFYTKYGDYIAWLALSIAALLMGYSLITRFTAK